MRDDAAHARVELARQGRFRRQFTLFVGLRLGEQITGDAGIGEAASRRRNPLDRLSPRKELRRPGLTLPFDLLQHFLPVRTSAFGDGALVDFRSLDDDPHVRPAAPV